MRRQTNMVDDARWTGLDVENGELGGFGRGFLGEAKVRMCCCLRWRSLQICITPLDG